MDHTFCVKNSAKCWKISPFRICIQFFLQLIIIYFKCKNSKYKETISWVEKYIYFRKPSKARRRKSWTCLYNLKNNNDYSVGGFDIAQREGDILI